MTTRSARLPAVLLLLLVLLLLAVVLVPVVLIRPFAPQTEGMLAVSYHLRRWSPGVTAVGAGLALWLLARAWGRVAGWWRRALLLLPVALALFSVWAARQNHFEWMFAPLPGPGFVRAVDARFVAPGDMVLAVARGADVAAYPVRQLAYHHLVQDTLDGVPIVATY